MKRKITLLLIAGLFLMNILAAKGGVTPFLASCCLGPRIGLEMNEDRSIRTMEWLRIVPYIGWIPAVIDGVNAFDGKSFNNHLVKEVGGSEIEVATPPETKGGITPLLASCCLGPRIGYELNDGRSIRTVEWLTIVPYVGYIPRLFIALEAFDGKTMKEIAAKERLDS